MSSTERVLQGRCRCGAVRYEVEDAFAGPWFEITDDLPQFEEHAT